MSVPWGIIKDLIKEAQRTIWPPKLIIEPLPFSDDRGAVNVNARLFARRASFVVTHALLVDVATHRTHVVLLTTSPQTGTESEVPPFTVTPGAPTSVVVDFAAALSDLRADAGGARSVVVRLRVHTRAAGLFESTAFVLHL